MIKSDLDRAMHQVSALRELPVSSMFVAERNLLVLADRIAELEAKIVTDEQLEEISMACVKWFFGDGTKDIRNSRIRAALQKGE